MADIMDKLKEIANYELKEIKEICKQDEFAYNIDGTSISFVKTYNQDNN